MPRHARAATSRAILAVLLAGVAPAAAATLQLPSGESAPPAASHVILLEVDDATGLLGSDLTIAWDPAVLQATAVTLEPLAASHLLTTNLAAPGSVRISLYGTEPLAGGGALIAITFDVVGPPAGFTPLDIVAASLNEGAIPETLLDGDFCVDAPTPVVTGLHASAPPGTAQATLSWNPVPYATAYNIYRGGSPNLTGLACYLPGVTAASIVDDGFVPPLNQAVVYLATTVGCGGESGLGQSSSGIPRPNPFPCL